MGVTKGQFVSNALWKLLESFSSKGVSFLVTIVLARLLSPGDYGLIAITTVFIGLSDILVNSGFPTALVQSRDVEREDYSAVLYVGLLVALILYSVVFFCAPLVAEFYNQQMLVGVLRALCLMFFFQAFSSVRTAMVAREMRFSLLFSCNLSSAVISGVLGVVLAVSGFGVWSLVFQQLVQQAIFNAVLFARMEWRPVFPCDLRRVRRYFGLSASVLASSLVSYFSDAAASLATGKLFSPSVLGYYSKGDQLPRQFSLYSFGSISSVMLPTFASYQDDPVRLKKVFRKTMSMTFFIVFPIMMGLAVVADPFVALVFGEQWGPAVPVLRCMCLYFAILPVLLTCYQLSFALGNGRVRLSAEILNCVLTALMLVAVFWGSIENVYVFAWGKAIIEVFLLVFVLVRIRKSFGYRFSEFANDALQTVVPCLALLAVSLAVGMIPLASIPLMLLQIAVGLGAFVSTAHLMGNSSYREIRILVSKKRTRRKAAAESLERRK